MKISNTNKIFSMITSPPSLFLARSGLVLFTSLPYSLIHLFLFSVSTMSPFSAELLSFFSISLESISSGKSDFFLRMFASQSESRSEQSRTIWKFYDALPIRSNTMSRVRINAEVERNLERWSLDLIRRKKARRFINKSSLPSHTSWEWPCPWLKAMCQENCA